MANSFNLHNRAEISSVDVDITSLETSARDRKNQLESVILQLKKMITHLTLITDDEVKEDDILED